MKITRWAELRIEASPDCDPMLERSDCATWLDCRLTHRNVDTESTVFDHPLWALEQHINGVAKPEGWALFDYDNSGYLQIQRRDEAGIFETDDEAIAFVREKAKTSLDHLLALGLDATFEPLIYPKD